MPEYEQIEEAPPRIGSTPPPDVASVDGAEQRAAAKPNSPAVKTAQVLSVELGKAALSALKKVGQGLKLVWPITRFVVGHPLTHKLLIFGGLLACTATFGALAVVSGGLFASGLLLLLAPTVGMAGLIVKQHLWPALQSLRSNDSQQG